MPKSRKNPTAKSPNPTISKERAGTRISPDTIKRAKECVSPQAIERAENSEPPVVHERSPLVLIEDLEMLERLRQTVQRHRIQMSNRTAATEAGRSRMSPVLSQHFQNRFQAIEDELTGMIASTVREHEMWPWLHAVKGIGPGLAGSLLASIDITRSHSVSGLWRYAGQGVNQETGERDRPTKGEKLVYNAGLKKTCYLVASSFLRSGSPYRREYDEAKEHYERDRPDWTPMHRELAARRKMVKLFLSHLHALWRLERKLPARPPYAIQVLRHDGVKPPWDYVEFNYSTDVLEFYGRMTDASFYPGQEQPAAAGAR